MTHAEYEKTRDEWLAKDYACASVPDCMCPKCDPDALLDRLADLAVLARRPIHEHPVDCACCEDCALNGARASKEKYRRRMRAHLTQRSYL